MKSGILGLVAGLMMAGPSLAAKKFWEEIPYQEWNREQVSKILTKSPWSHQFHISRSKFEKLHRPVMSGPVEEQSESSRPNAPGSVGITSRNRSVYVQTQSVSRHLDSTGGDFGSFVPVIVRWETALPVKWAWDRLQGSNRAENQADGGGRLSKDANHVVVSVSGLPSQVIPVEPAERDRFLEDVKSRSFLKIRNRARWTPTGAKVRQQQRSVALHLLFPRELIREVDPGDKRIEFATKISDQKISRKFKLKDMLFKGQLVF